MQPTLLPPDLIDRDISTLTLRHPRTGRAIQCVATDSALFQKVRVGTKSTTPRSLIFDNAVSSSAQIDVYVPVNPIYMVLPALFGCKDRFLPLDLLLQMHGQQDDEHEFIDEVPQALLSSLNSICQQQDTMVKLDLDLLASWFSARVAGLEIPESLAAKYDRAIAPIDPTQQVSESLKSAVKQHAAVELICSWLCEPVAEWLRGQFDFEELNTHVETIASERAAAVALQRLNERQAPVKRGRAAPAAKKLKPANNKSVLDFFKKKA